MKEVRYSTKAKKDLKKYRNDKAKMQESFYVLSVLANEGILEPRFKPHMHTGNYKDCMECHVDNDFLLIWIDTNAIYVQRIGSHFELF